MLSEYAAAFIAEALTEQAVYFLAVSGIVMALSLAAIIKGDRIVKLFGGAIGAIAVLVFAASVSLLGISAALLLFKTLSVSVLIAGIAGGLATVSLSAYLFYYFW